MVNSKSKLNFLWVLVIIPLMFVFSACGAGQLDIEAKCDTTGTYTVSDYETFEGVLGNQAGGAYYRLTGTAEEGTHSFYVNAIVGQNQFALKYTMKTAGNVEMQGKIYYTQRVIDNETKNVVYIDEKEGDTTRKGWQVVNFTVSQTLAGFLQTIGEDFIDSAIYISPQAVLESVAAYSAIADIRVNGTHFEFMLENDALEADITCYVNFTNDNNKLLQAYKVVQTPQAEVGGASLSATIEEINASTKIEFPNFNSYQELIED